MTRRTADIYLAAGCFALAAAAGLVGAFLGLETRSFWVDELYTAGIIEPVGRAGSLLTRIASDLNAPLYFLILFAYSKIAGTTDAALRSLSALSAVAAILLFLVGTRRRFSLPARLFAAAMATGSTYWFVQAQNARNYAFALLIGTGLLVLSLALLDKPREDESARRTMFGLFALVFVAIFSHFYLVLESVACLLVLAAFRPRQRVTLGLATIATLAISFAYIKLFVAQFSQIRMGSYWVPNTSDWYVVNFYNAGVFAFGRLGRIAILATILVFVALRLMNRGRRDGEGLPPSLAPPANAALLTRFPFEPTTALLLGVPVLMTIGAIASSILIAPNFVDRYILLCLPFLWGFCARLYDATQTAAPRLPRILVNLGLSAVALVMATIVVNRFIDTDERFLGTERFRESAQWIRSQSSCRGQTIPVLILDEPAWYKPGYAEDIYENAYARYLGGYAKTVLVYEKEVAAGILPPDIKSELQRRIDGQGCAVLAWSNHLPPDAAFTREFLQVLDRMSALDRVRTKTTPGYILYLDR